MMTPINDKRVRYQFDELPKKEKEYHEMVLLEEIDLQAWYAIVYSQIFEEEIFVPVQ